MSWQPIETAPRDGSHILMWFDPFPAVGYWAECDEMEKGGFWCPSENLISDVVGEYQSTHWQPLPPPPTE